MNHTTKRQGGSFIKKLMIKTFESEKEELLTTFKIIVQINLNLPYIIQNKMFILNYAETGIMF